MLAEDPDEEEEERGDPSFCPHCGLNIKHKMSGTSTFRSARSPWDIDETEFVWLRRRAARKRRG